MLYFPSVVGLSTALNSPLVPTGDSMCIFLVDQTRSWDGDTAIPRLELLSSQSHHGHIHVLRLQPFPDFSADPADVGQGELCEQVRSQILSTGLKHL